MNKTQKILLISFSALLALLLVALFVAAGVSVAKNGMQGLVGELFGDTMTQAPETMPEEQTTQSEADIMDILFDLDQTHKPLYEDYLKLAQDMTIIEAVAILGKPHYMDCAAGSRYLIWETVDGGEIMIRMRFPGYDGTQILDINTPDYGDTYVSSFYYNGPMEDEPETEQATNKLQEMFGFERTAELESIFDFDRTHEPTNREVQSIRKGMSYAEVIAIAGKPHGYYECGEFEDGDYTVFWCTQEGYEPCARWICFRLPDAYESEQERWSNAWVSDISAG